MFNLTAAQIHLAVNHLPVFGALLASLTLAWAALTRHDSARNLGLGLLLFAGLTVLPAYFSGVGSEDIVENRPGVSDARIERHEEAAEQALAVTLAAGAIAAAAFLAAHLRYERTLRALFAAALLGSVVSSGLMARAAHLGGQIRHDEIRSPISRATAADTQCSDKAGRQCRAG
jgi:hypothetical protein